jgi:peptide/nickel transport system ATP-binding protein
MSTGMHQDAIKPVLQVRGLRTVIDGSTRSADGASMAPALAVIDGIDFSLYPGETFAIVGESGCGKSITALSLMRLLPDAARVVAGQVLLQGEDLLALPESSMRQVRGRRMAMIFQEPATSLNPVLTLGTQLVEVIERHTALRALAARQQALAVLQQVGVPDAERRLGEYPFQLSGGLKQRVMIAMALATAPDVLVADEPTTALDVTIQAQVLSLLARLQRERGMAVLLITHDLAVVSQYAQRVAVMHAGKLVEVAACQTFFASPQHPYSQQLLAALPRSQSVPGPQRAPLQNNDATTQPASLLQVDDLRVHYPIRAGLLRRTVATVRAVDGVSLSLQAGRTLALVGESGCGKTTVGKAILQLIDEASGQVMFDGLDLMQLRGEALRQRRSDFQIIFQDPYASLNPRMRVSDILAEGMQALGPRGLSEAELSQQVGQLLQQVGLPEEAGTRYAHEFSGGQRQRIAIARALAVKPRLIVCDEPTSALDVSVQAQILKLLLDLQRDTGVALLFISHNIAVVEQVADAVAVMYLGRIVEQGPVAAVLRQPRHPYTRALLAAVPTLDRPMAEAALLAGELPSPVNPPAGCHFHPRCPQAQPTCREAYPLPRTVAAGHTVQCILPE